MNSEKRIIPILLVILLPTYLFAQRSKIDSLKNRIEYYLGNDTTKVGLLLEAAKYLFEKK
jgi:hypothetical protein